MTRCDRVRADAAGLAALPASDLERDEALAHARECPACARALDEAERLQAVVGALAPSPFGAEELTRASGAIVLELRREARWRMLASAVAVCAAFVLCVAVSRHRSPSSQDRAIGLALAASAAAFGAASRRWAVVVVAAAPIAALGASLAAGAAGTLQAAVGVDCLTAEMACSAAVVIAAWFAMRRGSSSLGGKAAAAGAAAGALGGAAALQITCRAHTALPHLLVFHVTGVLLASAAAATVWRLRGRIQRRDA